MQDEYILHFDGCSKGNPGPAGIGAVLYKNGVEYWSGCKFIGSKTNNESEYNALIFGLENAVNMGIKVLSVRGDSLLVIKQVNGEYKVKHNNLISLHNQITELQTNFERINFKHVYRNDNKRADQLSNIGLGLLSV